MSKIMLYINNTRHLDFLISKFGQVEGVVTVSRFDSRNVELAGQEK